MSSSKDTEPAPTKPASTALRVGTTIAAGAAAAAKAPVCYNQYAVVQFTTSPNSMTKIAFLRIYDSLKTANAFAELAAKKKFKNFYMHPTKSCFPKKTMDENGFVCIEGTDREGLHFEVNVVLQQKMTPW